MDYQQQRGWFNITRLISCLPYLSYFFYFSYPSYLSYFSYPSYHSYPAYLAYLAYPASPAYNKKPRSNATLQTAEVNYFKVNED